MRARTGTRTQDPSPPASARDSSRITNRFDRDPQRIAYDLWCLQENHRLDGKPLQPLGCLVDILQKRNPGLEDTILESGIALFLERTFAEIRQSSAVRHRYFFGISR